MTAKPMQRHFRGGIAVLACTMALHGTAAAQADPTFQASASANGINQSQVGPLVVGVSAGTSSAPLVNVELNAQAFATAHRGAVGVSAQSGLVASGVGCDELICQSIASADATMVFNDLRFDGPTKDVVVRLHLSIVGTLENQAAFTLSPDGTVPSALRRYVAEARVNVSAQIDRRSDNLGYVRGDATLVSFKDARPPTTCLTQHDAFGSGQACHETPLGANDSTSYSGGWTSEPFVVPTGKDLSLRVGISTSTRTSMAAVPEAFILFLNGQSAFLHTVSFPQSGPVFDLPDGYSVNSSQANIAGNQWLGTEVADDTQAPTIAMSLSSDPNPSGWHNTDVMLSVSAEDNVGGSGVQSITCNAAGAQALVDSTLDGVSRSLVITTEGVTTFTCTAQDAVGNVSVPVVVDVRLDKTPPTLRFAAPSPIANQAGWNNSNVAVPFTAADAGSGISSTNPPGGMLKLVDEGVAVTGTVVVVDLAGNTATFVSPAAKIDKTPPALTISQVPPPNPRGWNNTSVEVTFLAFDQLSGLAGPTSLGHLFTSEGAGQAASRGFADLAGNVSSATASGINIDKTAPEASAAFSPSALDVIVTGLDTLSGVDAVTLLAGSLRTYDIADAAGNRLRVTSKVSRDGHQIGAHLVSAQYNGGRVLRVAENRLRIEWAARRDGSLHHVVQFLTTGSGRTRTNATARFDARSNQSTLRLRGPGTSVESGDRDDDDCNDTCGGKIVQPGLVLLRLVTDQGSVRAQY